MKSGLLNFRSPETNREELVPGLRSLSVGGYLIFYLPIEDGIDVVRVLHGMREIDTLF